jgi:hypothetical protein
VRSAAAQGREGGPERGDLTVDALTVRLERGERPSQSAVHGIWHWELLFRQLE